MSSGDYEVGGPPFRSICIGRTLAALDFQGDQIFLPEWRGNWTHRDASDDWLLLWLDAPRHFDWRSLDFGCAMHALAVFNLSITGGASLQRKAYREVLGKMHTAVHAYLIRKGPQLALIDRFTNLPRDMHTRFVRRTVVALAFAFGRWASGALTVFLRYNIYCLAWQHFGYSFYRTVVFDVDAKLQRSLDRLRLL
jgi:hypothetical protein